jgi:uncharacterized membrane protein YfcA
MDLQSVLLLLGVGAVAGFLAGLFGVGGGIILVPILLYYFQSIGVSSLVATHITFGTSLLIIAFTSSSSAYQYWRNGHVIWKGVLWIGLSSVAGAWLGSWVAAGLQGKQLQQIFSVVVVVAALRILVPLRKPEGHTPPNTGLPGLIGTGTFVGAVSSLAGVGGGVFSIPLMYSLLRFPLKKALGTSSASIVITALAATAAYVVRGMGNPLLPGDTLGYVAYLHALPVVAGSLPMARVGAALAHKTDVGLLRKIFGVFLFVVAAKMFFL